MPEQPQVLMARQPIFDKELRVVAYELLYRSDDEREIANVFNGHQATSNVLVNAYTSIIANQERRQLPAFLNLPREMFETDSLPAMSHRQLVIEVLEDVTIDDTLIESVKRYKAAGYRIALDDFIYSPQYDPLLALADIVKVDILALGMPDVRYTVRQLKRFPLTMLAEKIETYDQLRECIDLGFKLFQGYFLRRPEIVEGRRLDSNETVLLQLLAELNNAEPNTEKLVALIGQDPSLTYRLLKIVNSAALSQQRNIENIKEALVILGLAEIRKWISLIALSGQSRKPSELVRETLVLAKMCELLAENLKSAEMPPNSAFLCGLLSRLDAILDIEKEQLLRQIAVSDQITAAVRDGSGSLGTLLTNVCAYYDGQWSQLNVSDHPLYQRCHIASLEWVNDTMSQLDSMSD
ncbi:histidine kinase [Marinobacterium zhoushanense]|uniref:Histidine kinase n=1 Tax=Marinobacterium zhoushanense TaxID=1679163 RepID=A0ABQ1KAD8_9GAMM|nr:HDOD domain-containing protein [Marinobacterium zhoushanense]GGB89742.1 histidine kinase [Marinobacterium zhoushanense]